MQRRIIVAVFVVLGLSSMMLVGVVGAQSRSPLVGIPHMSDKPDGSEMLRFPNEIDKVYLVFDYETDGPVEIIAEVVSEAQQGAVIFSSRETYNGTGTANIEVGYSDTDPFPEGVYDTIIRFGPSRYVTAGWEWVVGDVELPSDDISSSTPPISPLDERESAESQTDLQPGQPNSSRSDTNPSQTPPGLSPVVLAGIALVLLVLLAIIVWAVRGFLTAA